MTSSPKRYPGIHDDAAGGMTEIGRIIRDAWVFEIIPEQETCSGWTIDQINALYDKVSDAWAPYGHLASKLPPDLRQRHQRIHDAAVARARSLGWNPGLDEEEV
ncbi:MAG: hypothetical protein OES09_09100 [Gammaproteobacteria bacterium]|nr:hypothetical protein [Gammaproteobacteria bacterium]